MIAVVQVYLRALGLCGQSVALGGAVLGFLVLRPWLVRDGGVERDVRRALRIISAGAALAAGCQAGTFLVVVSAMSGPEGWPLARALTTSLFLATLGRTAACLAVVASCAVVRRNPVKLGSWTILVSLSVLAAGSAAWISHAASRLNHGLALMGFDVAHQLAAGVWVGGLIHLTVLLQKQMGRPWAALAIQRFSLMAQAAVVVLIVAASGLWWAYIGGLRAALSTTYGAMTLTKAVLFMGMLGVGGLNLVASRRGRAAAQFATLGLRRLVEVEMAIAVILLFLAASLGSVPPAADLVDDRPTLSEVAHRFTPKRPSLATPSFTELALASNLADADRQRSVQETLWSEYNHNVAGLLVLLMGILAILERTGRAPWARNWPLLFIGLAIFLLLRSDPETWPRGPQGFWATLWDPEVLQHRILGVVPAAFGILEWLPRTDRLRDRRSLLVFPVVCASAGALLLTHAHTLQNAKVAYLMEITHLPLGILAIVTGSARWLELRLPEAVEGRLAGQVWAPSLALIGGLLLFYREM